MEAVQRNEYYTYADYAKWTAKDRYEIADGMPYAMAPPSVTHQRIVGKLFRKIADFLTDKPCEVFVSPVGVRLNADKGDNTVFEPDIFVVCDESKISDEVITGAPDMVVEVLSKSTALFDKVTKFNKYLEAGVREYWIIDPEDEKTAAVYILRDEEYIARLYTETDVIPVHILDGCIINLRDIF